MQYHHYEHAPSSSKYEPDGELKPLTTTDRVYITLGVIGIVVFAGLFVLGLLP